MFGNTNIKEANNTIAKLQGELATATTTVANLQKTISEFPVSKESLETQIETLKTEHQSNIEALNLSHAEAIAKVSKDLEDTKASVMKQVSNKLSELMTTPEETINISSDGVNAIKSKYKITVVQ